MFIPVPTIVLLAIDFNNKKHYHKYLTPTLMVNIPYIKLPKINKQTR